MTDEGLALLRVATAAFFITTGYRKIFIPEVREKVLTFVANKAGKSRKAAWAVIIGEFAGGFGLLTGTLTHLAAAGLLIIMLGAFATDTYPGVMRKSLLTDARSKLASNLMCTPEWQLLVIVATLAFTGAGVYSIDHLIFN